MENIELQSVSRQQQELPRKQPFTLNDVKTVVSKWLYLEETEIIDLIMGAYVANQYSADPVWLLIIEPPSSAKTELLRGLDGHEKIFFLSNLTPSTLVSGVTPKKGPDPSLIYKIDGKILVLKDFTTILSMRSEQQQEILAQLREIYDGSYSKAFGTGKVVEWKGRVGLIAAVTPVFDKHSSTISSLGDRFILYRTNIVNQTEMGRQAFSKCGKENEMRQEIKHAFHTFLKNFDDLSTIKFDRDEKMINKIVALSCFCAMGRTAVDRDRYSQAVLYVPLPEGSPRLTKQLTILATGIALCHGISFIDDAVYAIIKKVGLSILPAHRRIILEFLWKEKAFAQLLEWRTTKEVADGIGMPKGTARLHLENMKLIGLLNQKLSDRNENDAQGNLHYYWQISDQAYEYGINSELFSEVPPF